MARIRSVILFFSIQALSILGYLLVLSTEANEFSFLAIVILSLPFLIGIIITASGQNRFKTMSFIAVTTLLGFGFVPEGFGGYITVMPGVLFVLIYILSTPDTRRDGTHKPTPKIYGKLLVVALLALISSTIAAWTRGLLNVGLLSGVLTFLLAGCVAYCLCNYLYNAKQVGDAVYTIIITATLSSLIWLPAVIATTDKRMYLPYGLGRSGMNELGGLLGMMVVLVVGLLMREGSRFRKLVLICALAVLSIGLVLSQSRGAWVGVFIGLMYIFVRIRKLKALLIPTALILLIGSFLPQLQESFMLRVSHTEATDPAWLGRVLMWGTVTSIVLQNPLLGVGLHNFGLVKSEYGFPAFFDQVTRSFSYRPSVVLFGHTHNLYLELLMGIGIVGAVAVITMIIMIIRNLDKISVSYNNAKLKGPALGLAALLITYLVHSFFDYTLWIARSLAIFAVFLGLSMAVIRQSKISQP